MTQMDPARHRAGEETNSEWSRQDSAIYIEELCTQLSEIARRQDMSILSYLLELARAEAGMAARDETGDQNLLIWRG